MRRHRKSLIGFTLLVLLIAGFAWHWQVARGPVYAGRHIADWVTDALAEKSSTNAQAIVLKIGAPAVPYIAREGLYGRSHVFHFLTSSRMNELRWRYPRITGWLGLGKLDVCVTRHGRAVYLLTQLGTNAQVAIPDVINCLKQCPELQATDIAEFQNTLVTISGTNTTAIPYFTRLARNNNDLRAAMLAYQIDGQTNLFIETCERIALKNPAQLATSAELYWFESDHRLNEYVVPLLERIYPSVQLKFEDRASILLELKARGADGTNAITRILATETNEPFVLP